MKKKSTSKSAFFNLRVLIGLLVVLAGILLALLGFGTFSNAFALANVGPNAQQRVGQMKVIATCRPRFATNQWYGRKHERSVNHISTQCYRLDTMIARIR